MSHDVKAVAFDTHYKYIDWNNKEASAWLRKYKFKPIGKVIHTEDVFDMKTVAMGSKNDHYLFYEIQETDPHKFKYRSVKIGLGIQLIIQFPKKKRKLLREIREDLYEDYGKDEEAALIKYNEEQLAKEEAEHQDNLNN